MQNQSLGGANLERLVEQILRALRLPFEMERRFGPRLADFVVDGPRGRLLIESKSGKLFPARLTYLLGILAAAREAGEEFAQILLVVDQSPPDGVRTWLASHAPLVEIVDVRELSRHLGGEGEVDLETAEGRLKLRRQALRAALPGRGEGVPADGSGAVTVAGVSPMRRRQGAGPGSPSVADDSADLPWPEGNGDGEGEGDRSDLPLLRLKRFFSYDVVARLAGDPRPLAEVLQIGEDVEGQTVLLSDIKNFSTLVKHADRDQLSLAMASYYRKARDIIWKHGGTLDKFIGDAVLAIFGNPYPDPLSARKAVLAGRELVAMGTAEFTLLCETMNDMVETGTRVGIATGELRILNIGEDGIEPTFVGDVINRAARLEKNCRVDHLMIDNATRMRIRDDGAPADAFPTEAALAADQLLPGDAKGQVLPQRVWHVTC